MNKILIAITVLTMVNIGGALAEAPPDYGSNESVGKYVDIDDVRLYFEVYGEGEPLLLVHGNGGSIRSFRFQIPELSKHFRVIVVDSRAQGRSTDSDKEITYALIASDIANLLDTLDIESAHVVGWSDGGIVGLEMAYAYPDRVKKLVAINANFTPLGKSVHPFPATAEMPDPESLTDGQRQVLDALDPARRPVLTPQPERTKLVRQKLDRLMAENPNFSLEQLETPTLVLTGDHDLIYDEHTLKLFQSLPHAQLCIVPGATHFVPMEKPALVNAHIVEFLQTPFSDLDRFYWLAPFLSRK